MQTSLALVFTQGALKRLLFAFPLKVAVVMIGSYVNCITSLHRYAIAKMIYACFLQSKYKVEWYDLTFLL